MTYRSNRMTEYTQLMSNLENLGLISTKKNFDHINNLVDKQELSFFKALLQLTTSELSYREERAIAKRISRAKFPVAKHFEEFDFEFQPEINKCEIMSFKTLNFLEKAENLIFIGSPGVGKTHLAISAGIVACEYGFRTIFITCHELLLRLRAARKKGNLNVVMRRYSNYELLIIDKIGYLPMAEEDANLLFQLINSRYERHSTIITTNVPLSRWGKILHNPAAAEAILDRLVHHAHIIKIPGKSYRLESIKKEQSKG